MTRRLIAGALWFVAVSSLVTFAETLLGQPRQLGTIFGIVVAGFVTLDPLNRIWPTADARVSPATSDRMVMPTERTPARS